MCPVCSTVRVVRLPPSGGELSLCAVAELNPWVRGTESQRDGETERQRDRETERQRDRETERQRDREAERRRLGRKKIFFENNFDFSEIRVIFVRS